MNSPFSFDLNEDQNPNFDHFKTSDFDLDYASSSSNSASCPIFNVNQSSQQFSFYHMQPLNHQDQGEKIYASHGEGLDHAKNNESCNKLSVCKKEENSSSSSSVKWMSSKMRLMKKMMKSDQTVANTSSQNPNYFHKFEEQIKGQPSSMELDGNTTKNNPNNTIRVCSDCNTTKTPLWRSGPRGPKSLCNACGIRQRKARRALAAAQESGNGAIFDATNSSSMKNKEVKSNNNNSHLPFKKRCKFTPQARAKNSSNNNNNNNKKKKLCFEDLTSIILSKNNSAYQQVFPQEEKEAAILLMALSYGLVRG